MSLKIIYLDDEPDLLEMFVDNFSRPEFEIKTFSDANLAIEEIKKSPPDLLILDFRLVKTTGDKVAQQVDPAIPKIMITGDLLSKTTYNFLHIFHKPYNMVEMKEFLTSRIKLQAA